SGPGAQRQREAIEQAIGPIWEANDVWLILVIVVLFTGFPTAFAVIMTALHIPMTAILVGIVLRGSAFVFRRYDVRDDAVHRRWSTLFGAASFFTPFLLGLCLGEEKLAAPKRDRKSTRLNSSHGSISYAV